MSKRDKTYRLLLSFLLGLSYFLLLSGAVRAEKTKENPLSADIAAADKVPATDVAIPTSDAPDTKEAAKKQPIPAKAAPKPNQRLHDADNSSQYNSEIKLEVEQDIMERALELLNSSQEYWVKGDIENALEALDQAYAILLDTNGDTDISRQKDDLRLLISKRILAIYTSKHTVTNGMRSEVPIVTNAEVEKEIRSFQTVERSFFLESYQRAFFYRPVILDALKKAGLPEELSWLPLVESGFKIRALSRARALGLWQFIPSTGYKYGLNREEWIDERMDVEKSTQAAIGYLKDLHDMFGDWLTVLAAYNCGEGRVLRVISGQHINYLDRFWDLYNQLPNETARYVPRLLATLLIIKDPQKYGMNLDPQEGKQPVYAYDTVTTNKIMNLQDIASRIDISEDLLSTLNAELRHKKTPDRAYSLKVPPESAEKLIARMDEIPLGETPRTVVVRNVALVKHKVRAGETLLSIANRYKTTTGNIRKYNRVLAKKDIKVGQILTVPATGVRMAKGSNNDKDKVAEDKKVKPAEKITKYTVKKGDTLFSLSQRLDMTVSEIKSINDIKGDTLKIGQRLKINLKTAAAGASGQKTENKKNYPVKLEKDGKTGTNQEATKTYVVKKGDNLNKIAQRSGSSVEKLLELNKIKDKKNIQPGQAIVLR